MIKVEDWGLTPYKIAWEKQKSLQDYLIKNPDSREYIILTEHEPVYTLGFRADETNILASKEYLENNGIECVRIERGGDVTCHEPGQLVVYPIINLVRRHIGVKQYVHLLEESIIELLQSYGISSSHNDDAIGVWLDWNTVAARKICALGVKITKGITMHGLALNVNNTLQSFNLINPCGITDKSVTSISIETGSKIDMEILKKKLSDIIIEKLSLISKVNL